MKEPLNPGLDESLGVRLRERARAYDVTDREIAAQIGREPRWILQQIWRGKASTKAMYQRVDRTIDALAAWKASEPWDHRALGQKLRTALASTSWTQAELARQMGLTPRIVGYVLHGKSRNLERYLEAARTLGLPVDWTDPAFHIKPPRHGEITDEERAILQEKLSELPVTQRELAVHLGVSASWVSSVLHGRVRTRRAWHLLSRGIAEFQPAPPSEDITSSLSDILVRLAGLEQQTQALLVMLRAHHLPIISTCTHLDGSILAIRSDGEAWTVKPGDVESVQRLLMSVGAASMHLPERAPDFSGKKSTAHQI